MMLGGHPEVSGLFEQPEKFRLWREAHGSIRVQEGEPDRHGTDLALRRNRCWYRAGQPDRGQQLLEQIFGLGVS